MAAYWKAAGVYCGHIAKVLASTKKGAPRVSDAETIEALDWLLEELGDPACPGRPSADAMAAARSTLDRLKQQASA